MVKIPLNEKYRIESDANQWIVSQRYGNSWKHKWFYSSLEKLVQDFVMVSIRQENCVSIEELLKEHRKVVGNLNQKLQSLNVKVIPIK
jgi:hypothetical protein